MAASVIAITNQKGGVGKTTTAAALLASLHRRGARVLGVDLDKGAHLVKFDDMETPRMISFRAKLEAIGG